MSVMRPFGGYDYSVIFVLCLVTILFLLVLLMLKHVLLSTNGVPTSQASCFRRQYIPYHVWYSKYVCLCSEYAEGFPGRSSKFFLKSFCFYFIGFNYYWHNHTLHVPPWRMYCCWCILTVLQGSGFSVPLQNFSNEQIINLVKLAPINLSLSWCSHFAILTVVALLRNFFRPLRWLCSRFAFQHAAQN